MMTLGGKDVALLFTGDSVELYLPKWYTEDSDRIVPTQVLVAVAIAKLISDSDEEFATFIAKTINTMFGEVDETH